jgi:antitoxin (DNA-binding transcriptional repressor) of toxin-antitoxin stability system
LGVSLRANGVDTSSKPGGVVGVKELRGDASAVIAEVQKGQWFLLSKRGNLVGVLLPSSMAEELLMEHAAEIVALQLKPKG